jgi:hypothetical protein
MPRFEHPQYQALLDRVKQDPTLEGSPEYTARKACALCCLCGVGTRCRSVEKLSRAWLAVQRRPSAGAAAPAAVTAAAAAAAAATTGPGPSAAGAEGPAAEQGPPVTYHAGHHELGPAPFHSRWLEVLAKHAAVMGKLEDQMDMWCHLTCCMQHSRAFQQHQTREQAPQASEHAAGSSQGRMQISQPSQPSQPPLTQPGSVMPSGVPEVLDAWYLRYVFITLHSMETERGVNSVRRAYGEHTSYITHERLVSKMRRGQVPLDASAEKYELWRQATKKAAEARKAERAAGGGDPSGHQARFRELLAAAISKAAASDAYQEQRQRDAAIGATAAGRRSRRPNSERGRLVDNLLYIKFMRAALVTLDERLTATDVAKMRKAEVLLRLKSPDCGSMDQLMMAVGTLAGQAKEMKQRKAAAKVSARAAAGAAAGGASDDDDDDALSAEATDEGGD